MDREAKSACVRRRGQGEVVRWRGQGEKHAVTISAIFTAIHELFTHMEEGMQAS